MTGSGTRGPTTGDPHDDDAPDDELDRAVRDALPGAGGPDEVARTVGSHDRVTGTEVRPGLVKTRPPLVELVVDYTDSAGEGRRRVYDLAQEHDGRLHLRGSHPA